MNDQQIKARLLALRDELETLRQTAKDDQKPVALDQQSVGRLSRMDSMQVQAMAQADDARRAVELRKIEAALIRLEDGEYGGCVRCSAEIADARLDNDPATPFCVTCAS